jgi:hypothetical protein
MNMKNLLRAIAVIGVLLLGAGIYFCSTKHGTPERPVVSFAPLTDGTLKDPDNPLKIFHVDFAKLEHDLPLSRAERAKLTPENLTVLSQEEIDQIYARLTAGPIPDGFMRGDLFFENGVDGLKSRLAEILGGGLGTVADAKIETLEKLGRSMWKGKYFFRDERVLRNVIEDFKPLEALIEAPDKLQTVEIPRQGLLSYVSPNSTAWLLFPAKLYCGQSLVDSRRESIIIDYAYTNDIPGYMERPDALAGRGGLAIRDEIRMVRPGFYLGRAYANRIFLLNFTIYDAETAENGLQAFLDGKPVAEDCWAGEQGMAAAP